MAARLAEIGRERTIRFAELKHLSRHSLPDRLVADQPRSGWDRARLRLSAIGKMHRFNEFPRVFFSCPAR
jgi:hypothetical protein